jgi:hypothetical protein
MVYGRKGDLHPDLVTEILEHATIKVLSVVNCYLLWNSIAANDVLPQEFLNGYEGYVGDGLRLDPLGEVLYCLDPLDEVLYCEGIVSLCWCEFANDVDTPSLQGPRWGDQL